MNITNVGEAPAEWEEFQLPLDIVYIENNFLYLEFVTLDKSVPSHETLTVKVIYGRSVENGDAVCTYAAPDGVLTNLVNCTTRQGLFATEIVITDPTQNASVDVEVTGTR